MSERRKDSVSKENVSGFYPTIGGQSGSSYIMPTTEQQTDDFLLSQIFGDISKSPSGQTARMSRVQTVRSQTYSFVKAHAICCNVTAVIFAAVGLPFLITGSVLVAKYQNVWWNHAFADNWENMIPEEPNTQHIKFASGVALIFFGIIFLIVGSISFACACCSMVAVRDEFAQQPVIMQQQMTQPYPQQAVYPKQTTACSNPAFCPQPAPSPMYFAQPPNYEQVMQANQTSVVQAPATSGGFPQPPQVPLPCLPDAPSEKSGSAE